ncbi:MAG: ATP-binding protein [Anaerolineae bacterium]
MGAPVERPGAPSDSRTVPTTGMRGGLGRTLLTAFLILTILPLALIGWYASRQNRRHLEAAIAQKLQAIAILKADVLRYGWLEDQDTILEEIADRSTPATGLSETAWAALQQRFPDLIGITALEKGARAAWSLGLCRTEVPTLTEISMLPSASFAASPLGIRASWNATDFILCYRPEALGRSAEALDLGETGHIYLAQLPVHEDDEAGSVALNALAAGERGNGLYLNHEEVPVVGAYAPVASGVGVLVEQAQTEALVSNDRIAATLIAFILSVALATTAIAAVVVRQITQPVVRLTESALAMADGDLEQHVTVTSRDEIGILTYVFNQMAADLKSLYDDLEAKVVERTKRLQQANYQIQWRALQLKASLEVSQAVTSIRDPALLLNRVAELICERFMYDSVAVYLVEPGGGTARRQAVQPADADWPQALHPGDGTLMERAWRKAEPQVEREPLLAEETWYRRTLSHISVPLRMEEQVLGVMAILSTGHEDAPEDNLETLLHLANQIAIALENARAYERERRAAQQLEEAEAFKSRFMANMSHALREPLNSIIGFSRLMLKGLDGELSEQQAEDVARIYQNSQHLLALINDILTITQIQAGLMALQRQSVDLMEVVDSVLPTADALVRGKDIALVKEIEAELPCVYADPVRLRQVLVRLLSNAAQFTEKGEITLRAWSDDEMAYVSVQDTGIGIPEQERARIFARFEKGSGGDRHSSGVGLGLALSKEFVEMHGGQIWVESEVGVGSQFIFSIPLYDVAHEKEASVAGERDRVMRRRDV